MKKKVVLSVLFAILIGLIGFIFSNSFKVREESTEQSTRILNIIIEKIAPLADAQQKGKIHKIIRKCAHATEYLALGIVLAMIARQFEKTYNRKYISFPLLIGLSIGVVDEFIQSFNDRSSEVRDVLIDFGGVVVGVAIVMLIFVIKDWIKKRTRYYY